VFPLLGSGELNGLDRGVENLPGVENRQLAVPARSEIFLLDPFLAENGILARANPHLPHFDADQKEFEDQKRSKNQNRNDQTEYL